jgi:hypothetical protein
MVVLRGMDLAAVAVRRAGVVIAAAMEAAVAATKPKLTRHYGGLIIPFFLATCLILGYWFYWSNLAKQIERQVSGVLSVSNPHNVQVTGFPYRLTLEVADLKLLSNSGPSFASSKLVATATPFNPLLWVLEGAENPNISLGGEVGRPMRAKNLRASLRLRREGIARLSITFDGLEAQGEGGWKTGKGLFHLAETFEDDQTLAFVTQVDAITLPKPLDGPGAILGQTINRFRLAGPISHGTKLVASTKAWREAGGKLTIMAGELNWGPVSLSKATGTLGLSAQNKLEGAIQGEGALKPEGLAVAGLTAPISFEIVDGRVSLAGLPGLSLPDIFR